MEGELTCETSPWRRSQCRASFSGWNCHIVGQRWGNNRLHPENFPYMLRWWQHLSISWIWKHVHLLVIHDEICVWRNVPSVERPGQMSKKVHKDSVNLIKLRSFLFGNVPFFTWFLSLRPRFPHRQAKCLCRERLQQLRLRYCSRTFWAIIRNRVNWVQS